MKILYSWLKDYVDINYSPLKLADDLSMFAHEVESINEIKNDVIFDLEITPNRGDCLSHLGIARQVAAMYDRNIKTQNAKIKIKEENINKDININIEDDKICPRYSAVVVDNIKIKESPEWIKNRLVNYGIKPINNIVDITNYIMFDLGQPMHAFDFDMINDGLINICFSKKNDELITLDENKYQLLENSIIIKDNEKIYDLAGIMGGKNSEISNNTKTIIFQAAIFNSTLIRKTAKYINKQTEASYRYERGVDPEMTICALKKAINLLTESCPEAKINKIVDLDTGKNKTNKIEFSEQKINSLLGTKLSKNEISAYLKRLYFEINDNIAVVPSFRQYDVKLWQDLAEEIARVYGYNNITSTAPLNIPIKQKSMYVARETIKDTLKNQGFTEIYSCSFIDKKDINAIGEKTENCLEIINPISPETQYLRPSLTTSILRAISKNPWAPDVNIFEIGKVFSLKNEKWQLAVATTNKNSHDIISAFNELKIKAQVIEISQKLLDHFKIRKNVKIALIDLDNLLIKKDWDINLKTKLSTNNIYKPISTFAPSVIDLSFIVNSNVNSNRIVNSINKMSNKILFVEQFDEYKSDKFGTNKKNVAFHIWIQQIDRPVDEKEVKNIIGIITTKLSREFNAELRGSIK